MTVVLHGHHPGFPSWPAMFSSGLVVFGKVILIRDWQEHMTVGIRTPLSRAEAGISQPCPSPPMLSAQSLSLPKWYRPLWRSKENTPSSITCKTEYTTLVCPFLGNTPPYSLELWDSCTSKKFLNVNPRFKLGTLEALEVKEMIHLRPKFIFIF